MSISATNNSLEQPFQLVKCTIDPLSIPFLIPLAHHNDYTYNHTIIYKVKGERIPKPYGVSLAYRVLPPQRFLKSYDRIRECLQHVLGLTTAQREVTLRLLRLWAYYGNVYPKAAMVAGQPGCSKATFWRAIRNLKDLGLILVINRYVIRPHAQTSNLYIFHKLLVMIARYLAEHGVQFYQKWLKPYLAMPGSVFWSKTIWLQESELAPPLLQ